MRAMDWKLAAVLGVFAIVMLAIVMSGFANGWGETAAAVSRKVDLLIGGL